MLIDAAMRYFTDGEMEYDKDAKWVRQGTVLRQVVEKFLYNHPYIKHTPPKTTGREVFGDGETQAPIDKCLSKGASKYDTLATITRITAQNLVRQYRAYGPPDAFASYPHVRRWFSQSCY